MALLETQDNLFAVGAAPVAPTLPGVPILVYAADVGLIDFDLPFV